MKKRASSQSSDIESAADSAGERLQESWEEFKEKTDQPFEEALDKVVHAGEAGIGKDAAGLWRTYRKPVMIGLAVLAGVAVLRWMFSSDLSDELEDALDD